MKFSIYSNRRVFVRNACLQMKPISVKTCLLSSFVYLFSTCNYYFHCSEVTWRALAAFHEAKSSWFLAHYSKLTFSCHVFGGRREYSWTILKLSFGTTKMAAYANKRFCTLVSKIYEKFYWVDIICPIPYKINICWYDLFDLISSLVNENNR